MATEIPITDYNQIDFKGQQRAIRPKLLKLTDDTRSRKKNKFKLKDLTASQPPRYTDDPAYTEDVRHLALPMRRNSGPDTVRRKSCSLLDTKIFERDTGKYNTMHILPRKKQTSNSNYKYDIKTNINNTTDPKYIKHFRPDNDSTSSDDSSYGRRGQSLDRSIYKQQRKMLCFQREKESQNRRLDKMYHRKAFSKEDVLSKSPRSMNEFASDCYDDESYSNQTHHIKSLMHTKERPKQLSSMLSLNEKKYSSLAHSEAHSFEQLDQHKTKEMSKFQIGKRFLRGEIGIKSFNYYLLKESLKSSSKKSSSTAKFRSASANQTFSKSEENIYEEIFFTGKKSKSKWNKSKTSLTGGYPDCELCIAECTNKNCEICKASEHRKDSMNRLLQVQSIKVKTPIGDNNRSSIGNMDKLRASDSQESIGNIIQTGQQASNQAAAAVLQYQSYNPKNPGVYKIETTPVAFTSDYNPIEDIYKAQKQHISFAAHKAAAKKISSSSSDSLHQNHQKYGTKPTMKATYYGCSNEIIYNQQTLRPQIYKTDSKASILSEMSIKSENSNNRFYKQAEMSDSSMGDSMFSYPAQRRYYGSAESCRFGYDCQPCIDGEKCSFSDNCRYECRNCDCSSSYFSSDFDDGNFSRKSSARMSNTSRISNYNDDLHHIDSKTSRYAEDFMKHLNNVKKSCNFQTAENPVVPFNSNTLTRDGNNKANATPEYGTINKSKNSNAPNKVTKDSYDDTPKKLSSSSSSKNSCSSSMSDSNGNKTSVISATGTIPKTNNKTNEQMTNFNATTAAIRREDARNGTFLPPNKLTAGENSNRDCDQLNDDVFERETEISNEKCENTKTTITTIHKTALPVEAHGQTTSDPTTAINTTNAKSLTTQLTNIAIVSAANSTVSNVVTHNTASVSLPASHSEEVKEPKASITIVATATIQAPETATTTSCIIVNDEQETIVNTTAISSVTRENANNVAPSVVLSPKQRNDGNSNNVSTRIKTNESSKTAFATVASTTTESKYTELKAISSSVVSEFASDASLIRSKVNLNAKGSKTKSSTQTESKIRRGSADAKVDRRIRKPIIEHHFTLPTSYKQKKRHIEHRKNATLERSSSKKNTIEQLVSDTTTKGTIAAAATVTATTTLKTNIESTKMHYHNPNEMPKYLFGERNKQQSFTKPIKSDEIFLNKSGWVQVNQHEPYTNRDNTESFQKYSTNTIQSNSNASKLEALITRNEIRKVKCTIDPKLSAILTERPGFLPIKQYDDNESPPPVTPIISPPPAFQDCKSSKQMSKLSSSNGKQDTANMNKGMVFSRSFEYDNNRKTHEYDQTFSKSFDYDFFSPTKEENRIEKENNFPNLTNLSPNYLTDKSAHNLCEPTTSVFKQYLEPKEYRNDPVNSRKTRVRNIYAARIESSDLNARPSRRTQFSKQDSSSSSGSHVGYRVRQTAINKRLNSCDSGARSDLSNDEEDEEDEPPNKTQRSRHLYNQQHFVRKQRSLTPENLTDDQIAYHHRNKMHTPEKRLNHSSFEGSQGSLLEKNPLRNESLERQQHMKIAEKTFISSRSSSSSSCSEAENELIGYRRSKQRSSGKSTGDNRIRRSRSLQLTERSPNRTAIHKTVVQIGANNVPKERLTNKAVAPIMNRRFANNGNNNRLAVNNDRQYKDLRNMDLEKSRSLDSEYEKYQGNSRMDFDKSRSFDENYGEKSSNQIKYLEHNNYPGSKSAQPTKTNSPQNYGNRLYEPDIMYDNARKQMSHSPLIGYQRDSQAIDHHQQQYGRSSRRRSPNLNREPIYRSMATNFDVLPSQQQPQPPQQQQHHGSIAQSIRDHSPTKRLTGNPQSTTLSANNSSFSSDYELNSSDFNVDYTIRGNVKNDNLNNEKTKLASDYYYDKANADQYLNQRRRDTSKSNNKSHMARLTASTSAAPSASFSCATSDCACGQSDIYSDCEQNAHKLFQSRPLINLQSNKNDYYKLNGLRAKSVAADPLYDSSNQNNRITINYNNNNDYNYIDKNHKNSTKNDSMIKANRNKYKLMGKPPIGERQMKHFFGFSLDEREMPITRERSTHFQVNTTKRYAIDSNHRKPFKSSGSPKQMRSSSFDEYADHDRNRSSIITKRLATSGVKLRELDRFRSRSLPCLFMRHSCSTIDGNRIPQPNLSQQMRAVSSPSLSDGPLDLIKCSKKPRHDQNVLINDTNIATSTTTVSVLQKFRKTFSNLKGRTSTSSSNGTPINQNHIQNNNNNNNNNNNLSASNSQCNPDITEYRFGPLIWRTSKERRKAKHHRRDKCNSGDSGIQVENDENISNDVTDSLDASPTINVRVKRANSAKVTSNTSALLMKPRVLKRNDDIEKLAPIPGRSLSQPYGLNQIASYIDDSDSDSESIVLENRLGEQNVYAEVLYSFKAVGVEELNLERGALVEVLRIESGPWWWGRVKHDAILSNHNMEQSQGWFPKDYVKVIDPFPRPTKTASSQQQEQQQTSKLPTDLNNCDKQYVQKPISPVLSTKPHDTIESMQSSNQMTNEAIKENVIHELLETEENYVKLLSSLCIGYLKELRQHYNVFPTESLILIFSNIEKIYRFQRKFVEKLRIGIEHNKVADTFLEFQSDFMVYSTYCNSYPRALMELETYTGNSDAMALLENCRIQQNLPELPLSAHLLAPIQRICRYPLHLSELVKHSLSKQDLLNVIKDDEDRIIDVNTIDSKETFELALSAMKRVTEMVNEGKRHSEYLSRIQARFDSYAGPPISVHSTRLFLQIDAIRMTPNIWNNTYTLFLFDRQLIYCKKDLLKRTSYIYKGRIFLDNCRILNLPDGKIFGVTLKNALRIYCDTRNKWLDFCFRSSSSKVRFLNTLSAERQFCGQSLFVSELAGIDDDNLSEKEFQQNCDDNNVKLNEYVGSDSPIGSSSSPDDNATIFISERGIDVDNLNDQITSEKRNSSPNQRSPKADKFKKSDTLPKKSRKLGKEPNQSSFDYQSNSLGRKRIGNWFRKAKSTNSTPSHSPTHQPIIVTSISSEDSSTQSSPVDGPQLINKHKLKDAHPNSSTLS